MTKRFVQYFGEFLRLRFEDTANAAKNIGEVMAIAETEFVEHVRNLERGLTEEERDELHVEMADEHMFFSTSEQFARRAMLVAAYAHFEDSLKRLCKHLVRLGLSKEKVPARSFYIGQARCFLSKTTGAQGTFSASVFGKPWLEIYDGWRHLRNDLMHGNGVLDFDKGISVPTEDGLQSPPTTQGGKSCCRKDKPAEASKTKQFIEGRSDVTVEFGELVLRQGAIESFFKAAVEATSDIIEEIVRIAPPSTPEPLGLG